MNKEDIKDYTIEELRGIVVELGEPGYRADQVFEWIYKDVNDFDDMTNLPRSLRGRLSDRYFIFKSNVMKEENYKDACKFLVSLEDSNSIETVLLSYKYGYTLCASSQVGCKMGCSFCASTINGFVRNLKPGEMVEQIMAVQRLKGVRISRVVLMGSGEPLDNYDNVLRFVRIINEKKGLNIGARHITISTCGIVPGIYKLADEGLQLTIAVSLHAASDEKRMSIMPINRAYPIKDIIASIKYYIEHTNKRVTFEYSMIRDFNDKEEDAETLALLIRGLLCHVNLIPVNRIEETEFLPSTTERVKRFKEKLEKFGINVTVRRSLGGKINAACGQLRRSYLEKRE